MEARSAPLDTDVLLNILNVLRKLDCKMEVQGRRLEVLETTSPISNPGSTLVNSPISRKQSTRTAASKRTLVQSGEAEDMNDYARFILKMDYAIDEANSVAEVSLEGSEKIETAHSTWADLVPEPRDVDLYSVSMYTGDLLGSRMSLDVLRQTRAILTPPFQSASSRPQSDADEDHEDDNHNMGTEEPSRVSGDYHDPGIQTVSRVESVAINTKETNTSPTYIKMELVFHAVDTWKQGVVSKIKNESRSLWEDEKRRFSELRRTYRAKDFAQRIVDKLGSALEKEWKEEKERVKSLQPGKREVESVGWRILISFRDMFNVSRESSGEDVVR